MIRLLITPLIFIASLFTPALLDAPDDVAALIKAGNAKELSKYMGSSVELAILEEEGVFNKTQAETMLRDFFSKHQPSSLKVVHKLDSKPNYRYMVVVLSTSSGTFRVSFGMKNPGGQFLISEFRIEENKG